MGFFWSFARSEDNVPPALTTTLQNEMATKGVYIYQHTNCTINISLNSFFFTFKLLKMLGNDYQDITQSNTNISYTYL